MACAKYLASKRSSTEGFRHKRSFSRSMEFSDENASSSTRVTLTSDDLNFRGE
jgi:hypothetical protein